MVDLESRYTRILDYLAENMEEDPIYDWILEETADRGIPEIQVTPVQGRFLRLLVRLLDARRVLEVGTLGGYSATWIARALPQDGRLTTLEIEPRHAELAREALERAGVSERVEILVGPALDTLATLELDRPLDMTFIDADKQNNLNYFKWAVEHSRSGGLVLVDNVLMNGRVAAAESEFYRQIDAFNRYVFDHYDETATVIPLFKQDEDNLDGLLIVRVP